MERLLQYMGIAGHSLGWVAWVTAIVCAAVVVVLTGLLSLSVGVALFSRDQKRVKVATTLVKELLATLFPRSRQ